MVGTAAEGLGSVGACGRDGDGGARRDLITVWLPRTGGEERGRGSGGFNGPVFRRCVSTSGHRPAHGVSRT